MDNLKRGDLVLCIGNLSNFKTCDIFIGKIGKIIETNINKK